MPNALCIHKKGRNVISVLVKGELNVKLCKWHNNKKESTSLAESDRMTYAQMLQRASFHSSVGIKSSKHLWRVEGYEDDDWLGLKPASVGVTMCDMANLGRIRTDLDLDNC